MVVEEGELKGEETDPICPVFLSYCSWFGSCLLSSSSSSSSSSSVCGCHQKPQRSTTFPLLPPTSSSSFWLIHIFYSRISLCCCSLSLFLLIFLLSPSFFLFFFLLPHDLTFLWWERERKKERERELAKGENFAKISSPPPFSNSIHNPLGLWWVEEWTMKDKSCSIQNQRLMRGERTNHPARLFSRLLQLGQQTYQ